MNIFKNLLFLHGDLREARFAEPARTYRERYGNKVASREAFPPLRGAAAHQDRRPTTPAPALVPCGCG